MAIFDMITKDLNSKIQYRKSENIVQDLKDIIDSAQHYACRVWCRIAKNPC
ncbi:MAG: hypothetical protein BWX78_00675 [Firmicutes bacterium ADurb.Bin099]|nr:MAG: hypothetical protein BWX78_00675 [Firmicutes bacterium ADurb.Bin099]